MPRANRNVGSWDTVVAVVVVTVCLILAHASIGHAADSESLRLLPPTQKFLPEDQIPASEDTLELYAARNEAEAFQAIIVADKEPLWVEAVTCAPLRAERGEVTIPSAQIDMHLVAYLEVTQPSWRGPKREGLWPDPLIPLRPFEVPAGENRIVWIRINVARDVPAGWYAGEVTVRLADAASLTKAFRLRVWNFVLPDETHLRTSFWLNSFHPTWEKLFGTGPQGLAHWAPWFDAYARQRLSTDVWHEAENPVKWFREPDGSVRVDSSVLQEFIEYSVERCHFNIINVGGVGCWGSSFRGSAPIIDRATGEPISKNERDALNVEVYANYLNQICDWLEEKGWLDRAYIQIWDEPARDRWEGAVRGSYREIREVEPRLKRLCVVGVHPYLQGYIDIWSPCTAFYDRETYADIAAGRFLYREKNFSATVTASSTGGWGNAAFYQYDPIDAYDGCEYTKWTPKEPATEQQPQWLRFDFGEAQQLDGLRLVPYQSSHYDVSRIRMSVEVSQDGENFSPVTLAERPGLEHGYNLPPGTYRAVRLVYSGREAQFAPSSRQPLPPPEVAALGLREVEFLRDDVPLESTREPDQALRAEMWEYNVGADYPSFTVDSSAQEQRCLPWQCWQREIKGFLYYGTTWWSLWDEEQLAKFVAHPPLVWPQPESGNNGGSFCFYPGADGPLSSIRTELWREGLEDYEYLWLARQAAEALPGSRAARLLVAPERVRRININDPDAILRYRYALARALDALGR